jgi:hypothetical protein
MDYFDNLYADYKTICLRGGDEQKTDFLYKDIVARSKEHRDNGMLTWDDLFTVEAAIIGSVEGEMLRGRARVIRDRYRASISEDRYSYYLSTLPSDIQDLGAMDLKRHEEALRGDLINLLPQLYWAYQSTLHSTRLRYNAKRWVAVGLAVLSGFILLRICMDWRAASDEMKCGLDNQFPVALMVVFLGGCGACISFLRRLSQVPQNIESLSGLLELRKSYADVFVAMVSGGLFALLLYLVFASGLLGELFSRNLVPNFREVTCNASGTRTLMWFITSLELEDRKAMAILFIWSFIAGFAEQLVPDVITRIVQISHFKNPQEQKPEENRIPKN